MVDPTPMSRPSAKLLSRHSIVSKLSGVKSKSNARLTEELRRANAKLAHLQASVRRLTESVALSKRGAQPGEREERGAPAGDPMDH